MSWLDDRLKKKEEEHQKEKQTWEEKAAAAEVAAKALEEKLAKLNEEREAERKALEQMRQEFDLVKQKITETAQQAQQPEQPVDFDTNPEQAVNQRLAPLASVAISNAVQTSRLLAQQQLDNLDMANNTMDGRLFRAWTAEIDAEGKRYPPQSLVTPEAWLGIFYYLKGRKADELSNPEIRKKKYSFLESAAKSEPTPQVKTQDEDKLTPEEQRICDRLGISPEVYIKNRKAAKVFPVEV